MLLIGVPNLIWDCREILVPISFGNLLAHYVSSNLRDPYSFHLMVMLLVVLLHFHLLYGQHRTNVKLLFLASRLLSDTNFWIHDLDALNLSRIFSM